MEITYLPLLAFADNLAAFVSPERGAQVANIVSKRK
jgi:hypothetical protein